MARTLALMRVRVREERRTAWVAALAEYERDETVLWLEVPLRPATS